jgi:hypothetical protein
MRFSINFSTSPEQFVGWAGVFALTAVVVYAFCRWLMSCPRTRDPWGADIEQAIEQEEAVPVCPHCLVPQRHNGWFCPECGFASSQYGNYLPSVYMFSIGDAVRDGVHRRSRWTPLLVAGYILLACAFLSILAPIYCLFLFLYRSQFVRHQHVPLADQPGA